VDVLTREGMCHVDDILFQVEKRGKSNEANKPMDIAR